MSAGGGGGGAGASGAGAGAGTADFSSFTPGFFGVALPATILLVTVVLGLTGEDVAVDGVAFFVAGADTRDAVTEGLAGAATLLGDLDGLADVRACLCWGSNFTALSPTEIPDEALEGEAILT